MLPVHQKQYEALRRYYRHPLVRFREWRSWRRNRREIDRIIRIAEHKERIR